MGVTCSNCGTDNTQDSEFCKKCATPLTHSEEKPIPTATLEVPKKEPTTGSTFAERYQIIEELGKGGMGKVYRALDKKLNEEVALKLIKPDIASDKKTIERFSNELKLARKISHRNVGRMYELMEHEYSHFITMEYVPGEDLKSFIRRVGQLPVGKALSITIQISEGLAEAHRLGVVHRDLKPSNIMIDKEGNPRILDFGIARSLKAKGITGTGIIVGTPDYMSPEQFEGKAIDRRSDIYSLGIILYEMVTGRIPFEADTPFAVGMKHKSENPKPPKDLNAQIPDDLNGIILKCLAKDKEERFQSAEDLLTGLINLEKGIPTTALPTSKRRPLTSGDITVQFNVKKLLVPALIFAVVVAAVVIWRLLPKKTAIPPPSSDKPSIAVMYFENNTGDQNLDHWRKALSELLSADLSQSKRLRILSGDRLFEILSQMNQLETKSYTSDVLEEVAQRGGVENIIRGSYTKAGDRYRVNLMLLNTRTGELLGSEGAQGVGESSFFTMVDELTRRIKANFLLSAEEIASDIDEDVGKITTNSPEAYKYYSEGVRLRNKGEYRQSIHAMENAIIIDPEFAMAYHSMALSYNALRFRDLAKTYFQKALEFSDRLSDRERLLIQGDFFVGSRRAYDRAVQTFKQLLDLYPDDRSGNSGLSRIYASLELWDEAIELLETNLQNRDDNVETYSRLAYAYEAKGLYNKANYAIEDYIRNFSDNAVIHKDLASNYFAQGKIELTLLEIERAFSLDPDYWQNYLTKGHVYLTQGDFSLAEKEYLKVLELEEEAQHLWGISWLGSLYLYEGKFKKSIDQLRQALSLSKKLGEKGSESGFYTRLAYTYLKMGHPNEALEESIKGEKSSLEERGCLLCHQNWALLYKGLAQIEKKNIQDAQKTAAELDEITDKELNRNYMRLYHHLVGSIEIARENFPAAIEYLKVATSFMPAQRNIDNLNDQAFFIEPLAFAYYKNGELEKARETYEQLISLTIGRLHWGYEYAKSLYTLGKIFEEKGWKGKAIEHYEKFLDLWKDADPGIAEVDDAKERLAGLR
ncbi:MAG: protein kinase, partial [Candidatus Aminicenantes bacterium]